MSTNEPKCKNCKYWEPINSRTDGKCRGDSDSDTAPIDGFVLLAGAADDWNLWVELWTGAEFSCARFATHAT